MPLPGAQMLLQQWPFSFSLHLLLSSPSACILPKKGLHIPIRRHGLRSLERERERELSVYLSVCLPACLSVCLLIHVSQSTSIYIQSFSMSISSNAMARVCKHFLAPWDPLLKQTATWSISPFRNSLLNGRRDESDESLQFFRTVRRCLSKSWVCQIWPRPSFWQLTCGDTAWHPSLGVAGSHTQRVLKPSLTVVYEGNLPQIIGFFHVFFLQVGERCGIVWSYSIKLNMYDGNLHDWMTLLQVSAFSLTSVPWGFRLVAWRTGGSGNGCSAAKGKKRSNWE